MWAPLLAALGSGAVQMMIPNHQNPDSISSYTPTFLLSIISLARLGFFIDLNSAEVSQMLSMNSVEWSDVHHWLQPNHTEFSTFKFWSWYPWLTFPFHHPPFWIPGHLCQKHCQYVEKNVPNASLKIHLHLKKKKSKLWLDNAPVSLVFGGFVFSVLHRTLSIIRDCYDTKAFKEQRSVTLHSSQFAT